MVLIAAQRLLTLRFLLTYQKVRYLWSNLDSEASWLNQTVHVATARLICSHCMFQPTNIVMLCRFIQRSLLLSLKWITRNRLLCKFLSEHVWIRHRLPIALIDRLNLVGLSDTLLLGLWLHFGCGHHKLLLVNCSALILNFSLARLGGHPSPKDHLAVH